MIFLQILFLLPFAISLAIEFDYQTVKDIILIYSWRYQPTCIRFLQGSNLTDRERHTYFKVFKGITLHSYSATELYPNLTVSLYSYDDYFEIRAGPKYQASCSKPLKVAMSGKQSAKEFAKLTHQYSQSNSLWLLFLMDATIPEFFKWAKVPIDTQIIAAEMRNSTFVDFHEVYRVSYPEHPLRILYFGNWTKSTGLNISLGHMFLRRSNLEGMVFRTGSLENWPLVSVKNGTLDGFFGRIWGELQELMNASSISIISKDYSMGRKTTNGNWTGLVGMLLDEEIDIIVADVTINDERSEKLSFTHPILSSRYQVYFKYIGKNLEWTTVFRPFQIDIWLAVILWLLVCSLSLSICHYFTTLFGLENSKNDMFGPTESFFVVLQSLCNQGYAKAPKFTSTRIAFLMSYALSAVLIPSYSASLISSIAYQTPIKPFNTLREMIDDGRYRLIVGAHTAEYTSFKRAENNIYEEVYKKLIKTVPRKHVLNAINTEAYKIICEWQNYALYGVEKVVQMKIEFSGEKFCRISSFNRPLAAVQQSFGLRKRSPYTNLINYHLNRMFDFGIISRVHSNLFHKRNNANYLDYKRVELDEIFHDFIFLSFGIILATVLFLLEKIHTPPQKDNVLPREKEKKIPLKKNYQYHFYIEY